MYSRDSEVNDYIIRVDYVSDVVPRESAVRRVRCVSVFLRAQKQGGERMRNSKEDKRGCMELNTGWG